MQNRLSREILGCDQLEEENIGALLEEGNLSQKALLAVVIGLCLLAGKPSSSQSKSVYKMPRLSDVTTVIAAQSEVQAPGRPVQLSLMYQSDGQMPISQLVTVHSLKVIEHMIHRSSLLMNDFLRKQGIKVRDCRGEPYNLIVIVVSREVLEDRRRFPEFFGENDSALLRGQTLYGYYDSTLEIANNSTILITDINPYLNEEVLAHELAHYWWDRLCLAKHFKGSSEDFAQTFHQYYMKHR